MSWQLSHILLAEGRTFTDAPRASLTSGVETRMFLHDPPTLAGGGHAERTGRRAGASCYPSGLAVSKSLTVVTTGPSAVSATVCSK